MPKYQVAPLLIRQSSPYYHILFISYPF